MYFTETKALRELELLMRLVPNFKPQACGSMLLPGQVYICLHPPVPLTYQEMITETMQAVRYRPFLKRLQELLEESEKKSMEYQDSRHQRLFLRAIQKKDRKNYAMLSALYLFTADMKLWRIMKEQVETNFIRFDRTKLNGLDESSYTLYCAAKDLCMGTQYLTIRDLADRELISPRLFALICNAMAIRRFGIKAVESAETEQTI